MRRDKPKREQLRKQSAKWLLGSLQKRAADSVARLEAMAEHLKAQNPDLAERLDWVISQAVERTQMMPEAVTTLYLMNTQEPPEIIEGEVIEVRAGEGQTKDEDSLEVGHGL